MLISCIGCPNNFAPAHRRPEPGDRVTLKIRRSDTNNEEGVALLSEGIFLGWLSKSGEMMNIMARLRGADLRGENIGMTAVVEATKEIEWDNGGGTCLRGTITIL